MPYIDRKTNSEENWSITILNYCTLKLNNSLTTRNIILNSKGDYICIHARAKVITQIKPNLDEIVKYLHIENHH